MISGCIQALALTAALSAAPAPKTPDKDVICTVNGEAIRIKDLEHALFTEYFAEVVKDVIPLLVKERIIRQQMADKGVSVARAEVDRYLEDIDRQIRESQKTTLDAYLAEQGMDKAAFRRKVETTLGLYRLAGGRARPATGLADPEMQVKMETLLQGWEAAAKKVLDPKELPAGAAAVVNGEAVTIEEVGHTARMTFGQKRKRAALVCLQRFSVIRQEIRRRDIEFGRDDIEYQWKLAAAPKANALEQSTTAIDKILEQIGRRPEDIKRQYSFRALAMLTRMVKSQVTEKALRDMFAKDPVRFGDQVPRTSLIALKIIDDSGRPLARNAQVKVRELAESLHKRLTGGEDFAKLAGEHSSDRASAARGGDLGYLDLPESESKVERIVIITAYGLKPGAISEPVVGKKAWYIVKVLGVREVKYEDAEAEVRATFIREKRNELLNGLWQKSKIEPGPARF